MLRLTAAPIDLALPARFPLQVSGEDEAWLIDAAHLAIEYAATEVQEAQAGAAASGARPPPPTWDVVESSAVQSVLAASRVAGELARRRGLCVVEGGDLSVPWEETPGMQLLWHPPISRTPPRPPSPGLSHVHRPVPVALHP